MSDVNTLAIYLFGALTIAGGFLYWVTNGVISDTQRRLDMASSRVRELKLYMNDLEDHMEVAGKQQAGKASYKHVEARLSQVIADLLLSKKTIKVKAK